ncbi:MAG TPA: hypothetical protein VNB90_14080 [Cytophagaceae bacterium]|jgi:hypothetical protein|nr:hypothetical protein [Cytophagaceae bacterium]
MSTEEISDFVDNHFEVTINERVRVVLKKGEVLHGFFKRHPESESKPFEKMKDKNQWEFFIILPENVIPNKPTIIHGEEVESMELVEVSQ